MRLYRSHTYIYPDLYYIWTYIPKNKYKSSITVKSLYRKYICGTGFYSRYHARHVIQTSYNQRKSKQIHIIKGCKLIAQGIRELPKTHARYIYLDGNLRFVRKWIYPPDSMMDRHRRRHFTVKMVKAFNSGGFRKFNQIYKKVFNGYRLSKTGFQLKRQEYKVIGSFVQEILSSRGYKQRYF